MFLSHPFPMVFVSSSGFLEDVYQSQSDEQKLVTSFRSHLHSTHAVGEEQWKKPWSYPVHSSFEHPVSAAVAKYRHSEN